MNMKSASRVYAFAALTALTACSGGGGHNMVAPPASTYDLQAGMANMVTSGLSANVTLMRISRKEGHRFTASRSMVSRHVGPLLVKQDVVNFPSTTFIRQ